MRLTTCTSTTCTSTTSTSTTSTTRIHACLCSGKRTINLVQNPLNLSTHGRQSGNGHYGNQSQNQPILCQGLTQFTTAVNFFA